MRTYTPSSTGGLNVVAGPALPDDLEHPAPGWSLIGRFQAGPLALVLLMAAAGDHRYAVVDSGTPHAAIFLADWPQLVSWMASAAPGFSALEAFRLDAAAAGPAAR